MRALDSNVAYSAAQVADPTGVSSYPGLMVAGYDMYKDPSLKNAGKLLLNAVGAIPLLGKATKVPLTLAKGYQGPRALNKANKVLDTVPEMIPGVRKVAQEVQNVTSGIITNPVAR